MSETRTKPRPQSVFGNTGPEVVRHTFGTWGRDRLAVEVKGGQ